MDDQQQDISKNYDQQEIELAKRITCAVLSYRADDSYQHFWNAYLKDEFEKGILPDALFLDVAREIGKYI